ncbi:MAG: hypothetical protein V7641_541 [Blastocatellia bacterium]
MKVCNEIKRRIDEADNVESFDLDITRHAAVCDDCRRFAGERAALKALIASTARVNAPLNFEAVLQARLAEVKAHRSLAWLNAAFYLRAGAATAALVAALFVAQYNGLFSGPPAGQTNAPDPTSPVAVVTPSTNPSSVTSTVDDNTRAGAATYSAELTHRESTIAVNGVTGRRLRATNTGRRNAGVPLVTAAEAGIGDGGAIFIPGRNGEHDITVPTVSVGAQPLIYVNSGRQQQSARAVSVSF